MIIWVMSLRPSVVRWFASQRFRLAAIFSMVGVHGVAWSTPLPIHAPRTLTGWPSPAILMFAGIGEAPSWVLLVSISLARYSAVPIGMISVFAMLKTAPDTLHHGVRACCSSVSKSSDSCRYVVASSAKNVHLMFSSEFWTSMPFSGDALIVAARGSIPRSNRRQESASPWRTPLQTRNASLTIPFITTEVEASW